MRSSRLGIDGPHFVAASLPKSATWIGVPMAHLALTISQLETCETRCSRISDFVYWGQDRHLTGDSRAVLVEELRVGHFI